MDKPQINLQDDIFFEE